MGYPHWGTPIRYPLSGSPLGYPPLGYTPQSGYPLIRVLPLGYPPPGPGSGTPPGVDGQMDGWMDGWMDRHVSKHYLPVGLLTPSVTKSDDVTSELSTLLNANIFLHLSSMYSYSKCSKSVKTQLVYSTIVEIKGQMKTLKTFKSFECLFHRTLFSICGANLLKKEKSNLRRAFPLFSRIHVFTAPRGFPQFFLRQRSCHLFQSRQKNVK